MSDILSISSWLHQLQAGEAAGMQRLWDTFSRKLLTVVTSRLRVTPIGKVVDGEEIVASVFESIWDASQNGRLKNITDIDELLWLLLSMTRHKCIDHLRRSNAIRRGGGKPPVSLDLPGAFCAEIISAEPDPQYVAALNEQYQLILDRLPDASFRSIAVMKIEGFSNEDIAAELQTTISTVQRKLKIIRRIFKSEFKNG